MGSACSSQNAQVSATDAQEDTVQPLPEPSRSVWKIFPSISEAKGFYKAEGTFDTWVDPGHLELRTLLDEPSGQHSLGGKITD
jgi:hypothetical protein